MKIIGGSRGNGKTYARALYKAYEAGYKKCLLDRCHTMPSSYIDSLTEDEKELIKITGMFYEGLNGGNVRKSLKGKSTK